MGNTLKRFNSIRRTDDVTDGATSEAIAGAVAASETQEQFQTYFLSRLRQLIFGEAADEHWYDDPFSMGVLSLRQLSLGQAVALPGLPDVRLGVTLVGVLDGHNRIFRTSPERFIHDPTGAGATIELWHNGRKLIQVRGSRTWGDFRVEESAGVGTGYDTVNLLTFSPVGRSALLANYYRAL